MMKLHCPLFLAGSVKAIGLAALSSVLAMPSPMQAQDTTPDRPADVIRFATFNAALSGETADDLPGRLATPDDAKLQKIAAIIQTIRPDVLLINEFDYDPTGQLAADFQKNYLGIAQADNEPISFTHAYSPPVNTGLPTGIDLNGDGTLGGPADAHGWGEFPGQYGMLLMSRLSDLKFLPIWHYQEQQWQDYPGHSMPDGHFSPDAESTLRLSSKSHVVMAARWGERSIAVHLSHPTPPVFDGVEDRNGRRNFDEIGLIALGVFQMHGLPTVVLGDLNADPNDGESRPGAIQQLLNNPMFIDPQPRSRGAVEKSLADGGINTTHLTDPALDTADWGDQPPRGSGNLRVDYVLPTKDWRVVDAGVFWPTPDEPGHDWIDASDHRLVWVDLTLDAE